MKNFPKKFNAEKAIEEFENEKAFKNIPTHRQAFADWLAEYIPAHEAKFTNIEQVQRINKFLEEEK